jgi:hypothetical protein
MKLTYPYYSPVIIYPRYKKNMVRVGEATGIQPFCRLEGNRRWKSEK